MLDGSLPDGDRVKNDLYTPPDAADPGSIFPS
jgi:hypothetical protein